LLIPSNGRPSLADVIATLIQGLTDELATLPPPPPAIAVLGAEEQPVGLASLLGFADHEGLLPPVAVKGGRLAAALRITVQGSDPAHADAAVFGLHGRLLGARDDLRAKGFLRLDGGELTAPEPVPASSGWQRTASYKALFEYSYLETDGATGLITRIPVEADPETLGSPDAETSVVVGSTVRWDREGLATLVVRGPGGVGRLSTLAYLPLPLGAPPVAVAVLRTFTGAAGAPAAAATLQDLAGSPHAVVSFATLSDFLVALPDTGDAVELADWDPLHIPDPFAIHTRAFSPEIALPRSIDRLEISASPASGWGGGDAVLYLRAAGA
jgi:hypothetical protein